MTVKSFFSVNSGKYFVCPRSDNLWKVCHNKHGKMRGQFWRGCLGGGYITGETTSEDISGHNITYIFPNLEGMLLCYLVTSLVMFLQEFNDPCDSFINLDKHCRCGIGQILKRKARERRHSETC